MPNIDLGNIGIAGRRVGDEFVTLEWMTGEKQVVTRDYTCAETNKAVATYTAMGKVTATGKVKVAVQTATDGSQIVIGFAARPMTSKATEQSIDLFVEGMFNPEMVVWDGTFDTDAKKAAAMPDRSLYLQKILA
ncbi:MAG: head decoration protein [Plesiomonas shigelloides]